MFHGCRDLSRSFSPDRRAFLRAGLLGTAGLALPQLLAREAKSGAKSTGGREPSVIILWMRGGPSHIDMWDPKPDAPAEYRGEFGVMPDERPRHPAVRHAADVRPRSWTSGRSSAACTTTTPATPPAIRSASPATTPAPTPTRTSTPAAARSSSRQLGHQTPHLPAYVMIPRMVPGHRLGLPGRGAQAVRDAGRPGQRPARSACRTSTLPAGRDARAARRPPRAAAAASTRCAATSTPPGRWTPWTASARRRGTSSPRTAARDAFDLDQRAGASCASATASCRRSTPRRRTAAAPRRGASASCWPGGWSRRACGW